MKNQVAVVYWSGTGNTEAMANLVAAGVEGAGGTSSIFVPAIFDAETAAAFDCIAFGCPAMGCETLEDCEFQPMYDSVRAVLSGKKVGLFGSYGWGDGQWIRDWNDDISAAGAVVVADPVAVCGSAEGPDADACKDLGAALANA